jgi:hypothetical protein
MEASKIEPIGIDKLIFDPENPRLPTKYQGYGKEEDVLEWMLMNENVIELMGSIGEKGYFQAEPLLIVKSVKKKGYYEVVEGNRRLAAVKLLNDPRLSTFKRKSVGEIVQEAKIIPKELPTIIFDKRDDILVYLGYRHITGIKEWGPLAKAKYLDALRKNLKIKDRTDEYRTLAKIIGSKANYVRNILAGLQVYKIIEDHNFFEVKGLDEVTVEFGVLYTAIGRSNISTFVGIDLDAENPTKSVKIRNLKELTSWMFEQNSEGFTRLGESRNLSDLDQVVSHPAALKYFREGRPLSESVLYTGKPISVFNESLNDSINSLKVARDQLHHIDIPEQSQLNLVEDLIKIASDVRTLLKAKKSD